MSSGTPSGIRPSYLASFARSQAASIFASAIDFGTCVLLTEKAGFWYVLSTAIGAVLGAGTHFLLGRYWSFVATHDQARKQAVRYAIVAGLSLGLNTYGVYFVTEHWHIPYAVSRLLLSFLTGVFFNFPLHRHWVFR